MRIRDQRFLVDITLVLDSKLGHGEAGSNVMSLELPAGCLNLSQCAQNRKQASNM